MSLIISDDNEHNNNNNEEYNVQQQFANELNDDNNLFFLSDGDYVNDSVVQHNNISLSNGFDIDREPYILAYLPLSSMSVVISLFLFIVYFISDNSSTLKHGLFVYSIYYKHQYYRILTNNFVHSNFPQVLYNVFMFIFVYSFSEKRFGTLLSLLLFCAFILFKSFLFVLCSACDLMYFGNYSIENGFTLIIIGYFTFTALASEYPELVILGIIYYAILYFANYIYEPFNLWYGVIVGMVVYVFNKFVILLPKREWILSFEKRFGLCNEINIFQGNCIIYYPCSGRDQEKIKKYF